MTKFVPYEKMSKKQKRETDAKRRATWGDVNPVTRRPENSRAYNRKKAQQWKNDPPAVLFVCRQHGRRGIEQRRIYGALCFFPAFS